ncbi:MAG: J domain-containing protein [Campylobacterales bacterium]|nr:J domain-containing protein [Campylobacterales bacterium]
MTPLAHSIEAIYAALETLNLPVLSSLEDLKRRYREMVQKHHHDIVDHDNAMPQINHAYEVLKRYMEGYKFSFSEEEIMKQFPEENHAARFKF